MLARLQHLGLVHPLFLNFKMIRTLPSGKLSFDEMVSFRKKEARASVVIQVRNPLKSVALVNQVCSRHATVKKIFHYTIKDKELLLLELDSEASVANLLANCSHSNEKVIPAASPFLWLRAMPSGTSNVCPPVKVFAEDTFANDNLEESLSTAESVSHQITLLEEQTRLSEIGCRLRWITCVQVEQMLSGLFPSVQVLPFGSFVNGCGRYGCDLDMAVSLDGYCGLQQNNEKSPLVFHAKPAINNARLQTQRHIEVLADILQNFTTGCTQVQRVLQARVPIVKFYHEFTGVDCDISMGSLTGVFMSELLYLYGEMDCRFRPLVTAVRHWAAWARLTDIVPSPRITNFTLTLLVVFHLQRCSPPILPTLNEMIIKARPQVDYRQTNEIDCNFLRDPNEFRERCQLNKDSLEDLFWGFLRFVESFDFNELSVSIITGKAQRKTESKPLYVQNPFERELNVSRNVNLKELTRLVMEARNALYILETREAYGPGNWGLLALPRAEKVRRLGMKTTHQSSKSQLDMKDFFTNDFDEKVDNFEKTEGRTTQQISSPELEQSVPASTRPVSGLNGFINAVHRNAEKKISSTQNSVPLKSEKVIRRTERQKRK